MPPSNELIAGRNQPIDVPASPYKMASKNARMASCHVVSCQNSSGFVWRCHWVALMKTAIAIQVALAQETWLDRAGNPETYAPLLRTSPPWGSAAKHVLFQNAYGDQTVPNPTNYTVLAAGNLFDRESLYRNDKTAQNTRNPHGFLLDPSFPAGNVPGQQQVVAFFASGGTTIIDPDGPGDVWEVPIADPSVLLHMNFPNPLGP
jgi:hypothetical protein